MTGWLLIVHILAGGYAEPFHSEWACRLALAEAAIVWRWERGATRPGASCRMIFFAPGDSAPRSRPPGARTRAQA